MSRVDIIDKLHAFFKIHDPITEECHAVYVLVEIRKVLDRDYNDKYPLLRFYCDWCVHTQKDRITPQIKAIMEQIYASIEKPSPVNNSNMMSFIRMEDMRNEMSQFLVEYNLTVSFAKDSVNWIEFIKLMVNVLADQPIIDPCAEIAAFYFITTSQSLTGTVALNEEIDSKSHYTFSYKY